MKNYGRTYWFTWGFLILAAAFTGVASIKGAFFGGLVAAVASTLVTRYDSFTSALARLHFGQRVPQCRRPIPSSMSVSILYWSIEVPAKLRFREGAAGGRA